MGGPQFGYAGTGSPYGGGNPVRQSPNPKPYREPKKSPPRPLAEAIKRSCVRCGAGYLSTGPEYSQKHLVGTCPTCATAASIGRLKDGPTAKAHLPATYLVTCLRCGWTARLGRHARSFECGKDPRHPVQATQERPARR